MKPGQKAMVYEDPITRNIVEGVAVLVRHLRAQIWEVQFEGDDDNSHFGGSTYIRTVIEPSVCAWCRYYKDEHHNPTRRTTNEEYDLIQSHGICKVCRELQTKEVTQ